MNYNEMRELEELCIQEHAPPCSSACPVHVDIRSMNRKIRKGDIAGAFDLFKKSVFFPGIIAFSCNHPCETRCNRKDLGGSLAINDLERYCYRTIYAENPESALPRIPRPLRDQHKTVAVAGYNLRGASAAYSLYEKGFTVTVLGERFDGRGLEDISEDILTRDLGVFLSTGVEFKPWNGPFGPESFREILSTFDAVVFTGTDPVFAAESPDMPGDADRTFRTPMEGVFACPIDIGEYGTYSPIFEVSTGKRLAISVERYLKKVSLLSGREMEGAYETRLYTSLSGKEAVPGREFDEAAGGDGWALSEAGRCMDCSCLECVRSCVYLEEFGRYPRQYIREISNNLSIVFGIKTAKPLVNSCSLCGLCGEVCPNHVNMRDVSLFARKEMVRKGSMPPAIHDFPIRDMLSSNEARNILSRHQPGRDESAYLFFPGCQLVGIYPHHVLSAYRLLSSGLPGGTGILLGCCGAPARWSGREALFQETIQGLKARWDEMGKGRIITACTTCKAMLAEAIPEAGTVTIWEILADGTLPDGAGMRENLPPRGSLPVALLDPCTARHDEATIRAVRGILARLGLPVEELPFSGRLTKCCGYGGLVTYANPQVAEKTVRERLAESNLPYVTYCAMCREAFAGQGKEVRHLFDYIFGCPADSDPWKKGPGISERQDNRLRLKRELLRCEFGEDMDNSISDDGLKIFADPGVMEILDRRLILLQDVRTVIAEAERTGRKFTVAAAGRFIAHLRPGIITYWVEYSIEGDGFRVHNAYSHRLEIVERGSHNG